MTKKRGLQPVSDLLRKMAADPDTHPAIRATIAGEIARQERGRPETKRVHRPHPGCPCIECHRALHTVP